MEASLEREMSRAKRRESSVGIIMMDVDHFKKFNDDYGHEAGDLCLAELGAFLQRQLRTEDIPCRYGGEEFILIMPGASVEDTANRAEQIRHDVEKYLRLEHKGTPLPEVTISLGVSAYPFSISSVQDAVSAADAALYQSKEDGRNRVTLAPRIE